MQDDTRNEFDDQSAAEQYIMKQALKLGDIGPIIYHKDKIERIINSIRHDWTPCLERGVRDDKRAFELLEMLADYGTVYRHCYGKEIEQDEHEKVFEMIQEVGMYISGRWEGGVIDWPFWMNEP